MNEEQIEVIQSTWSAVVPIADAAANIFYDKLFESDPSIRTMFPGEMADQKKKLMQTLGMLINSLDRLDEIVPVVQTLGAKHVDYGVREEHYPKVGAALLATLEVGLGDQWNDEVKDAWSALYSLVSQVMIDAARKASVA